VKSVRFVSVALALVLAGCATLFPLEQRSLTEVHTLIDATTTAYGVTPLYVLVGAGVRGVGGTYHAG
jgi:hypothetical protein